MADNPDVQWALELLEPYKEENFMYKNMPYIFNFGIGMGFACYANLMRQRPVLSGIQQHLFWGVAFSAVVGGSYIKMVNYKRQKEAAITRDYIIKHPEDFPPPKAKTWADILDPWVPIR